MGEVRPLKKSYDVIVIGGGIGGLSLSALLAHGGMDMVVVERNGFLGGRCTGYINTALPPIRHYHLRGVSWVAGQKARQ